MPTDDDDMEQALPLIDAAEEQLYSHQDFERCIELCDRALEVVIDDDDFVDAILFKAEAEIALGDRDESARRTLGELDACELEDAVVLCDVGTMWWALRDDARAERAFARAVELDPDLADAHHGLGLVYEQKGARAAMIREWLRVRELDLAAPPQPWHLSEEEFEQVAEAALAEIPREVLDKLENVPVLVEPLPAVHLVEEGYDPRLFGLFSGVAYPDKSHITEQSPHLDSVHLYQRNLEGACADRTELEEEIRITVLHETAHFFGLDDEDLDRIGLG